MFSVGQRVRVNIPGGITHGWTGTITEAITLGTQTFCNVDYDKGYPATGGTYAAKYLQPEEEAHA